MIEELVVWALATWRMAYLAARERGPWGLVERVRERLGGALACLYCASVWAALLVWALWRVEAGRAIVTVLAISALALLLHRYTGGDHV